jgi:rhodanese-related sulfurtransferase
LTPCARGDDNTAMAVTRITKEDLKQKLDGGDDSTRPVLLDVRLKYPFEHSTVKLPGAIRLVPNAPQASDLPKGRDLVLYCSDPDEITSSRVAAALVRQGFRAQVLKGGVAEWIGASFPTEPRDGSQPAAPGSPTS